MLRNDHYWRQFGCYCLFSDFFTSDRLLDRYYSLGWRMFWALYRLRLLHGRAGFIHGRARFIAGHGSGSVIARFARRPRWSRGIRRLAGRRPIMLFSPRLLITVVVFNMTPTAASAASPAASFFAG